MHISSRTSSSSLYSTLQIKQPRHHYPFVASTIVFSGFLKYVRSSVVFPTPTPPKSAMRYSLNVVYFFPSTSMGIVSS